MSLDINPHYPVMLNEVITSLEPRSKTTIVDCTFGCGGYSQKILETFPDCKVIGISVNTQSMVEEDANIYLMSLEKEFNLPATDPFRFGADKLVDALASLN